MSRHAVKKSPGRRLVPPPIPWKLYAAELIGTALLVMVGLSIVIADFGRGSPLVQLLPDAGLRRFLTGFLFGATGAAIAVSPLGKESGAHINPVVTLGFWLMGRLKSGHALGYVMCQLAGALLGAVPLLAWGAMGRSVAFGATVPGAAYGAGSALLGETVATFALVFGLFFFLRRASLKAFTPALFPPLYAIMVWLEAPISGTSTNPARSFGPAIIANAWSGWWVYWLGPLIGAVLAVAIHRWADWPLLGVAKIHHFEHDPYNVFHI
ncbi:MAG: aquaporin [Alphaproteobacteria bacterium]|nr:aquaporin [Alphaproteobacteria bacterium]MDE2109840.1 aquaporin [Alphaproteobacteria bacterium]MDE2493524.1 aquaporin [Alphaproteobacteria bacterium]